MDVLTAAVGRIDVLQSRAHTRNEFELCTAINEASIELAAAYNDPIESGQYSRLVLLGRSIQRDTDMTRIPQSLDKNRMDDLRDPDVHRFRTTWWFQESSSYIKCPTVK